MIVCSFHISTQFLFFLCIISGSETILNFLLGDENRAFGTCCPVLKLTRKAECEGSWRSLQLSSEGRPCWAPSRASRAPPAGTAGLLQGVQNARPQEKWILTFHESVLLCFLRNLCWCLWAIQGGAVWVLTLALARGERSVGQSGVTGVTWRCHLHRGVPRALFSPCPALSLLPPFSPAGSTTDPDCLLL